MRGRETSHQWPTALVFDFDGVIGDTQACWDAAYGEVLAASGRELDHPIATELVGASVAQAALILDVEEESLNSSLRDAFRRTQVKAMPGANRMISATAGRMPIAVATNGPEELVREALASLELIGYFDVVVSGEAIGSLKPAPDVYDVACEQLGVDPTDAIAIEDSILGVAAAAAAGLFVVQVGPGPAAPEADLRYPDLNHPGINRWLQLPSPPYLSPRTQAQIVLHRTCSRILRDERVGAASAAHLRKLTAALRSSFVAWVEDTEPPSRGDP